MKITDPRTVDPEIITEVCQMFRAGFSHNEVISKMRAFGLNKIECMKLFRDHAGVTLGEAKDIVHLSPAWADRYDADEAFHDAAEKSLDLILKKERTAA